jgi:hypothetical protein
MEFFINFGLYILAGMMTALILIESGMICLSGNDKWRIRLTQSESLITIVAVLSLAFLGGYLGVSIQAGFSVASSNLSLFTDNPSPPEYFAQLAPQSEPAFMSFMFTALLSLPYLSINSYWIRKRRDALYRLKQHLNSSALRYSKDIDQKHIQARIEDLTTELYHDTKAYCH